MGWNLTFQLMLKNRLVVRPINVNVRTDSAFFLVGSEHATESGKLQVLVDWILAQTEELRHWAALHCAQQWADDKVITCCMSLGKSSRGTIFSDAAMAGSHSAAEL